MPFWMTNYIQSVMVQGTVYIGGGLADGDNKNIVMAYDVSAGRWATLPPYSTHNFAMSVVDSHLVLVGGKRRDDGFSKVLGVWSEDSKKWTHPYPDMTIPRRSCSAFTYKSWLVVAGGTGAGGRLSSVEVMNTDIKRWYAGPPTPIAWSSMKSAIVDDMCYFMGGTIEGTGETNKAYSVSLPALISQLNSDSFAEDTQTWKKLPPLPVKGIAPLSVSGSLLVVGGIYEAASTLHLYQPDAGEGCRYAHSTMELY